MQFREVCLTVTHLCIVMEYASGGDLFEYVLQHKAPVHGEGIPEASACWFFTQLMVAVEFCHELGIANRCHMLCCSHAAVPAHSCTDSSLTSSLTSQELPQGRQAREHPPGQGYAASQREAVRLWLL